MIVMGVAQYGLVEHQASLRIHDRDRAFHIAEAGVNYYRWHLAHAPNDFQDGTGIPGPYVHTYADKDGNTAGIFELEITPPLPGTTVATIRSTGWILSRPEVKRTIQVRVGYPALTDYVFVEDTNMRFSRTTEVHGKVHANSGIQFDGRTDALVRSATTTYYDSLYGLWKPGIWGAGGPQEFWDFPVPSILFDSITGDLTAIRTMAENGGVYLRSTGREGYRIVFLGNGVFALSRVERRLCYQGDGYYRNLRRQWDSVCADYDPSRTVFLRNENIPANGVIFVEDDVWVEGVVDRQVTLAAGRLPAIPSQYREIYISGNITYAERSSDDVLGLLAQDDIIVPLNVPNNMEIDAAALSQFNRIRRPYYRPIYPNALRNSLIFFGSQISRLGGGWKVVNQSGQVISGFINTNHTYDGNLLYSPPPGFPVGDTYELISWEEVES